MPKRRSMKEEESNGGCGLDPEYGAIFMSSRDNRKESFKKEIFGLPIGQSRFVKQVKSGMVLFLFDFESRELHGVFQACCDGGININPNAFCSFGRQFPAQVKFTEMWRCSPLRESEFRDAISENYYMPRKFNFGLSKGQVQKLLKLFSLRKVERHTTASKPKKNSDRNVGNRDGDRSYGNHRGREANGDIDSEFTSRDASARDYLGSRRRSREDYGFGEESDIGGVEYDATKRRQYSGETSRVYRRTGDSDMYGAKDRVGNDDFYRNNNFAKDGLSDYSVVTDRRVPKNLRHTSREYYKEDGTTRVRVWSNHEPDPVVQSYDPSDHGYMRNPTMKSSRHDLGAHNVDSRGYRHDTYDPEILRNATMESSRHDLSAHNVDAMGSRHDLYEPEILRNASMKSSRHDLGSHYGDSMGSASFKANSDYALREDGGYRSDTIRFDTFQPFSHEHNVTGMNKTSDLGLDYYIPMPMEHPEYQTNSRMLGNSYPESDTRDGHLHHSQYPAGNTENMSYSNQSTLPSYIYPLSSRDLSPKDRVNNEGSTYRHQEEYGGRPDPYSDDRLVRDSRIHPSVTYPPKAEDGVDLYRENRTHYRVHTYQEHEDPLDNRVSRKVEDIVPPAELERKGSRKSVFSRLAVPSKEREAKKDSLSKFPSKERDARKDSLTEIQSVDEVMDLLNDCHKHWTEQKRLTISNRDSPVKLKKKKVIDVVEKVPVIKTTRVELLDCDESVEQNAQKQSFVDFQRRSKAQKSSGSPPAQGCSIDSPRDSTLKRKLLRPKLIEDDTVKDNPAENSSASQSSTEVPDLHGRGRSDTENKKRKLMRPKLIKDDSEKDKGNNDNHDENSSASQSPSEVPDAHDVFGCGQSALENKKRKLMRPKLVKNDSGKDMGKNENPTASVLASQSRNEVHVVGGGLSSAENEKRKLQRPKLIKDDSEEDRANNDNNPTESSSASESPSETVHGLSAPEKKKRRLVRPILTKDEDRGNNDNPTENVSVSVSPSESPVHGRLVPENKKRKLVRPKLIKGDSENDRGNNDNPRTESSSASESSSEVPIRDLLGRVDQ